MSPQEAVEAAHAQLAEQTRRALEQAEESRRAAEAAEWQRLVALAARS